MYVKYEEYKEKPVFNTLKGLSRIQSIIVFDSFYQDVVRLCYYQGFIEDYKMFLEQWDYSGGLIFNIYDFLYIFKYCHNYSLNMYILYFGILQVGNPTPPLEIAENFINQYGLQILAEDFLKFVYKDLKDPDDYSAYLCVGEPNKIGLWEFVF